MGGEAKVGLDDILMASWLDDMPEASQLGDTLDFRQDRYDAHFLSLISLINC